MVRKGSPVRVRKRAWLWAAESVEDRGPFSWPLAAPWKRRVETTPDDRRGRRIGRLCVAPDGACLSRYDAEHVLASLRRPRPCGEVFGADGGALRARPGGEGRRLQPLAPTLSRRRPA